MEKDEDFWQRRKAFAALLKELAMKLGKENLDIIEVSESVPQHHREKGGMKLLEHLQHQGKFSLWRTAKLRDILRNCDRHDLADVTVKNYQQRFLDLPESPITLRQNSTCDIKVSSLVTRSPMLQRPRPTSSPTLRPRTPQHHHAHQCSVDSVDYVAPYEEVSSVESRSTVHVRGFESTGSQTSQHSLGVVFPKPLQERVSNTATSSPMPLRPNGGMKSASCQDLQVRLQALSALYNIASGTSMQSVHSCDHYNPLTDHSEYDCKAPHSATFSDYPEGKTIFQMPPPVTVDDYIDPSCITEQEPQVAPAIHNTLNDIHEDTNDALTRDTSKAEPTEYRTKLPWRRLSAGNRKQLSEKITWQIKRDNLMKCLTKPGEVKITFSQKLDVDVGQGKYNPKISVILYPNGLFYNEGKSVSLQAKIATPDKCPPLNPSLLVRLNVIVSVHNKSIILKKASTQVTINMHSFFIHDLFTCDSIKDEDSVLLEISTQTQKPTEQ